MTKKQLGDSILETLQQEDLSLSALQLGEATFDTLLEEGVVKNIPVMEVVFRLWKSGAAVRDYLFVKKLYGFLTALDDISQADRINMVYRLRDDEVFGKRVGENIILLLDRLDSIEKAELMGRAFRAYCRCLLDGDTLSRINVAIDRLTLRNLSALKQYFSSRRGSDDATRQSFVNAGLAYVEHNTATTRIKMHDELCQALVRHVLRSDD